MREAREPPEGDRGLRVCNDVARGYTSGMADYPRTVTGEELRRDTRAVIERAEREGPIAVLGEDGKVRMVIHCPRDKRPVSDP